MSPEGLPLQRPSTRQVQRIADTQGSFFETELASISSVEYTVDSKGVVKPTVKAYHADVAQAEAEAAATLKVALKRIKDGEFSTGATTKEAS